MEDNLRFHQDWLSFLGPLPPLTPLEGFSEKYPEFRWDQLASEELREVLTFLRRYEKRFFENQWREVFHRPCGGGAVIMIAGDVYCSRCGQLETLITPSFLHDAALS